MRRVGGGADSSKHFRTLPNSFSLFRRGQGCGFQTVPANSSHFLSFGLPVIGLDALNFRAQSWARWRRFETVPDDSSLKQTLF